MNKDKKDELAFSVTLGVAITAMIAIIVMMVAMSMGCTTIVGWIGVGIMALAGIHAVLMSVLE